jgi:hypothetical protein
MIRDFRRRWSQFWDAIAECRRAETEWNRLRAESVDDVAALLTEKERRHLAHTVFRINALLFLYSRLRGAQHNTRLGVLLGATTHLLDFVYDHSPCSSKGIATSERAVMTAQAQEGSPVDRTLGQLAGAFWPLIANRENFAARLEAMVETQRSSLAQENGGPIAPDALEQLTEEKGHRSLCLYFAAVNPAFDDTEAAALRRFGLYMQYMDDLEDFYEDRAENRTSPVTGPGRGALRATALLASARRDLQHHYGAESLRGYRIFMFWLSTFHVGILAGCASREVTRRLPPPLRKLYDSSAERVADRFPFFNVAPVGISYYETAEPEARLPVPVSLVLTLPVALARLWKNARSYAGVFEKTVDPLLERSIRDDQARAAIREPLLQWGVKGGYMVGAYERLARLPTVAPLAVLCGAAGRLYDDLLEQHSDDPALASRLESLFRDEVFEARTDYEELLRWFYDEIHLRLRRRPTDPVFDALVELHTYQCRTHEQRVTSITEQDLDDITYRKGGLTLQILYGMARPEMSARERDVIHLTGATLQLLDDYQDEFADRAAGLTTKATRGEIRAVHVWRRLAQLEQVLSTAYGSSRSRRYVNELRIQLGLAALGRRSRALGLATRRGRPVRQSPLRLVLARGANVAIPDERTEPSNGGPASSLAAIAKTKDPVC